jgi:very-short-patch-repair endonuclease
VVSHLLAAALRGYLPFPPGGRVDVSGPRLCRLPTLRVHRVRLHEDEVTLLRGMRVTSPARTVLDLAAIVGPRQLEQALAAAERSSGTVRARIRTLLQRRPRHPGSAQLRRLLDGLDATGTRALYLRSAAEEGALARFRDARLPEPACNVDIAGLEVDFAWQDLRLVVEIDGFAFHGSEQAFHRDRDRDRTLGLAGYIVLRFTWRQVERDRLATIASIAMTIGRQQALLARAGVAVGPVGPVEKLSPRLR